MQTGPVREIMLEFFGRENTPEVRNELVDRIHERIPDAKVICDEHNNTAAVVKKNHLVADVNGIRYTLMPIVSSEW